MLPKLALLVLCDSYLFGAARGPASAGHLRTRGDTGIPCGIIGDAGSSGTRIYLYHGTTAAVKAHDQIKGGLAKDGVARTMLGLGPLLSTTYKEYETLCSSTENPSLSILGTAGTRLLPEEQRNKLWADLEVAINDLFPARFRMGEFRTLSGKEEGLFAVVAANFLEGKLNHDLEPSGQDMVGVMDLGGASTQIALPRHVPSGSIAQEDLFLESYLGYGVNEFKATLIKKYGETRVNEACLFSDTEATHPCRAFLTTAFSHLHSECANGAEACPGRDVPAIKTMLPNIHTIYMMSGYIYTVKFAAWLDPTIDMSKPASLSDIEGWATSVCKRNYAELKATYDAADPNTVRHTAQSQFDERCLHMEYIVILLRQVLGYTDATAKMFHFSDTINGEEVDWPLGAYLYQSKHGTLPDTPPAQVAQRSSAWLQWLFIIAVAFFLYKRWTARDVRARSVSKKKYAVFGQEDSDLRV